MKTWNGAVTLSTPLILPKKIRLTVWRKSDGPGVANVLMTPSQANALMTPGQAMQLANRLRRWAMGNLRRAPDTSQWALTRSSEGKAK
jgi:hypothetical protein